MKKNSIFLILLIVTIFTSCYKDDSTANYKIINPIVISGTENSFELFSLDTLRIKPLVYKEGIKDEDLSFKWTIYHSLIVPTVLDSTMSLKVVMPFSPHASPYTIIYEVTDKTSGISIEQKYDVKIISPFGTGLIVCHSEDGKNSDVSLIRSWNYQHTITNDTIMSNLFSRVNNRKLDGITTGAVSTQYGNSATLTLTTPNAIERVDPRDYKFIDSGNDVFLIKPDKINPVYIVNDANSGNDILNNNGNVHVRSFQSGNRLYGYKALTPDMTPASITKICKPYWEMAIGFDKLNGRFLAINSGSQRFDFLNRTDADKFGWNEFQNYDCLSIVFGADKRIMGIMKNKTTNDVEVFSFIAAYSAKDIRTKEPFKLLLQDCPDIDKAILFETSERANVVYYATPTKIYAANYLTGVIRTTLEYETNPGEEITTMYVWSNYRAGGKIKYTNPNPNADQKILEMGSQNRMMVISTYNAAKNEGYVKHLGILSTSTGELEKARDLHVTFGGFGKISITQFQEK